MPTALTTPIYETPTIYVNAQRIIISRQNNSQLYKDKLNGTAGADVIVGTIGKDDISGRNSNDVICSGRANNQLRASRYE